MLQPRVSKYKDIFDHIVISVKQKRNVSVYLSTFAMNQDRMILCIWLIRQDKSQGLDGFESFDNLNNYISR